MEKVEIRERAKCRVFGDVCTMAPVATIATSSQEACIARYMTANETSSSCSSTRVLSSVLIGATTILDPVASISSTNSGMDNNLKLRKPTSIRAPKLNTVPMHMDIYCFVFVRPHDSSSEIDNQANDKRYFELRNWPHAPMHSTFTVSSLRFVP
ncbi:hypothetical protein PsorP6_003628 [Peronosclerospora sorghi]|uniref:Uncharacterized protein n=1 Tax=Peronosclerospora sorghi TaxID=230839 RepID=A0ACC0VNR0_9STRA|nr:hypothetical protein PsorP6_003628 [Peronosclerospora sorghi]